MFKRFQLCMSLVAVLLLAACGGDDNNANTNNTNNGTNNLNNGNNLNNDNNLNNVNNIDQCAAAGGTCTVGDPTAAGFTCVDGTCVADVGTQCSQAAEACVGGMPTTAGFECVEDVCEASCSDMIECASGSLCVPVAQGAVEEYCLRSDCTGIDDDQSCVDGTCTPVANNTFLCLTAGTVAVDETCTFGSTDPAAACLAGLQCLVTAGDGTGFCVEPCDEDADCGGDSCIGEAVDFITQGFGFCGESCTSYDGSAGNCSAGTGCVPLTNTEGICDSGLLGSPIGTVVAYEPCVATSMDPAELCAPNARCIGFQGEDVAAGIPAVARCLPYCDASAASAQASDATCEGPAALCFDSGGGMSPLSGFCFSRCAADSYGQNLCVGTENKCLPFGEDHVCFPGGDPATEAAVGQACNPNDVTQGCQEIADCEADGAGNGLCRGRCNPDAAGANVDLDLGCVAGEVCDEIGSVQFNFGLCGTTCTPTNYADVTCPANLQTCIPETAADASIVCKSSGNIAVGQACGSVIDPVTCVAGAQCANDWSFGVHGPRDQADGTDAFTEVPGTCYESCDLYQAVSGCGAADSCVPHLFLGGTVAGICVQNSGDVAHLQPCATGATACGDAAICTDVDGSQAAPVCLHFCNRNDANSCPVGMACNAFVADFGICQ